ALPHSAGCGVADDRAAVTFLVAPFDDPAGQRQGAAVGVIADDDRQRAIRDETRRVDLLRDLGREIDADADAVDRDRVVDVELDRSDAEAAQLERGAAIAG